MNIWQKQLQNAITDPKELFWELQLDLKLLPELFPSQDIIARYPLKVPRSFVQRMQKGNIDDPLLRQILPLNIEQETVLGFSEDPLAESKFTPIPGLIHKYFGRVLLLITRDCAINCRFCFRRHGRLGSEIKDLQRIFDYIANDKTVEEIIFSGGEPLLIEDDALEELINYFAKISHLKRLRIHTRLPILIPDRVGPGLVQAITSSRLQPVIVIHSNHPDEIDAEVTSALHSLRANNVILLNQSVLLKGVNDNAKALMDLSEKLIAALVLPYYLHVLDKVAGAAHFAVDLPIAQRIYSELQTKLPGYLVPKMVCDKVNALYKINAAH